jgi:6-phosphogluconolactonase (cycloisomerase 2 family)
MLVLGCGDFKPKRITAEIAVRGTTAYTTTWGNASPTSAFYVWDVSAAAPTLVDSVLVTTASTLGDVAVTDDGQYLVVATEYAGGSIAIYSLADPRKPAFVSRFSNAETNPGCTRRRSDG